ncbi:MAG: hypothetical protein H6854_00945 [Rhodospirillales bacterium]|nr:hypothetical protein [Rhodospirillales bacterium]
MVCEPIDPDDLGDFVYGVLTQFVDDRFPLDISPDCDPPQEPQLLRFPSTWYVGRMGGSFGDYINANARPKDKSYRIARYISDAFRMAVLCESHRRHSLDESCPQFHPYEPKAFA